MVGNARGPRLFGVLRGADGLEIRFWILVALLLAAAVFGGSNRPDHAGLAVLRPLTILGIGAMLLVRGNWNWSGLRWPAALLGAFAISIAIQLVPLPASWWMALPGHAQYRDIAALAPTSTRPIALAPDLAANALLALLPAAAALIGYAGLGARQRARLAYLVLGVIVLNAAFAMVQITGGVAPALASDARDDGVVTGLLSNRNHGAIVFAMAFPLAAVLLRQRFRHGATPWIGLAGVAAIALPLILLTGSRQGLLLSVLALLASAALLGKGGQSGREGGANRRLPWIIAAAGGAIALIVVAAIVSGRAISFERLANGQLFWQDARWANLPGVWRMVGDFLPFGIGHGAFNLVYRGYESDALLHSTYFNHVHNDFLELVVTGGVPSLLPAIVFVAWLAVRGVTVLRQRKVRLAKAALVIAVLPLAASLVDYPLRTGLIAMLFTIACCWIAAPVKDASRRNGDDADLTVQPLVGAGAGPALPVRLALGVAALAGAAAALSFTLSMTGGGSPVRAGWILPTDTSRIAAANALLGNRPGRVQAEQARALSIATLTSSPVNAVAVRNLALSTAFLGDVASARRQMLLAERLSRRDAPTQMWLIEDRVAADDLAGALLHYHRALQTSRSARDTLLPVLAEAADDPAVVLALVPYLAAPKRPEWWSDFLGRFVERTKAPAALARIAAALRLNPDDDTDRARLLAILAKQAELGDAAGARALYFRSLRRPAPWPMVTNGDFERDHGLPPIDWQISEQSGSAGVVEPRDGAAGQGALTLSGSEGREAARQLLALPPGSYRLSAVVGSVREGLVAPPTIAVLCVAAPQQSLLNQPFPLSRDAVRMGAAFTVPAGCGSQWLLLSGGSSLGSSSEEPWIDQIAIRPNRGTSAP